MTIKTLQNDIQMEYFQDDHIGKLCIHRLFFLNIGDFFNINKKVLLRERKRHTARRVAIAISCYSGGGGPLTKKFFPSLNMYQAKSSVKNFSLY